MVTLLLADSVMDMMHRSRRIKINCKNETQPTIYDSFLLTEGEGIILDCEVCSKCTSKGHKCGYGGRLAVLKSTEEESDKMSEIFQKSLMKKTEEISQLRLRIMKRMWPNIEQIPEHLRRSFPAELFQHNSSGTSKKSDSTSSSSKPEMLRNRSVLIRFTYKYKNEKETLLRPNRLGIIRERVDLRSDRLILRQTQSRDSGVYTCQWNHKPYRVWAITIHKPGEEPYRYRDFNMDNQKKQSNQVNIPKNSSSADGINHTLTLETQVLPKNNLVMFTEWYPWSPCVPCIPTNRSYRPRNITSYGLQIRVGICRVTLLDMFLPVKPHQLTTAVDQFIRSYSERGLPCRSHLIRSTLFEQNVRPLLSRPSEMLLRSCQKSCNKNKPDHPSNKAPKPIRLLVSEGDQMVLNCPITGTVRGPITWFFAPIDANKRNEFEQKAFTDPPISRYLLANAKLVNLTNLLTSERGLYRLDPAYNLIISVLSAKPKRLLKEVYHLFCVHGDPGVQAEEGFSEWVAVITVEVTPSSFVVYVLSRLTSALGILIPLILALGIGVLILWTIRAEHKSSTVVAAKGLTKQTEL